MIRIIKKLLSCFNSVSEEKELEPDSEPIQSSLDDDLKTLEQGAKYLAEAGETYLHHDNFYRPIFAEYKRQKENYRIQFEFIPPKQNFRNVRSFLQYRYGSYEPWKEIRDFCEEKSESKCVICGCTSLDFDPSARTKTECHEVWGYHETRKIQTLLKLQSLCCRCHQIKHINRFSGKDENSKKLFYSLMEQYCTINGIDMQQALKDFEFAVSERKRRAGIEYWLDLKLLNKFDYEVTDNFNCHEQSFITFLETKFKSQKDIEQE